MRQHYAARAQALTQALTRHASALITPVTIDAGLDVAVYLKGMRSDRAVERRLAAAGIEAVALSRYAGKGFTAPGLVLGFAAFDEPSLERAVVGLSRILA